MCSSSHSRNRLPFFSEGKMLNDFSKTQQHQLVHINHEIVQCEHHILECNIFKTNDVIKRKGFWLMINSKQALQVSYNNRTESTSITTTTTSLIPLTESSHLNHNNIKHHHTFSYILILIILC
ncbi:unnamed protein product [Rotaria sp. Silwood2]|nr:unnamed protein product [Rotaria sp. Silwood2]CAF4130407.1 unnamed protein product [Rotaria sp. Silwood2]CAF4145844.1 unnamed protein product [Rotaria sp. Silwood2]